MYCLRFHPKHRTRGPLTVREIQEKNVLRLQVVRSWVFGKEMRAFATGEELHVESKLLPFHIFLDDRGILRVGRRLWHLNLPYVQSHPILMAKGLRVIRPYHSRCVHSRTLSLYNIRISLLTTRAPRAEPFTNASTEYVMGQLLAISMMEGRSFVNRGVD